VLEGLFTPGHLILILILALIFFGPKKLPEFGHALGKTFREFKTGVRGDLHEEDQPAEKKDNTAAVTQSDTNILNADNQKAST
jgi:sec-independent protein translocase protein TatA